MNYFSVIACLWLISGTLLTHGYPETPKDKVLATAKSEPNVIENGTVSAGDSQQNVPSQDELLVGTNANSTIAANNTDTAAAKYDSPTSNSTVHTTDPTTLPPATNVPPSAITTTPKTTPNTKPTTPTTPVPETTTTTATPTTTPSTTPTTTLSTTPTTTPSKTPTTAPAEPTTIKPSSTKAPPPTKAPSTPPSETERRFDGPSFIGGIVFASGVTAIGFVAWKFYKARTERNYHTL